MLFSRVLDSVVVRNGVATPVVPDEWMQGRSVFGGLQAALAVRALRAVVPRDVPLRVMQTTFVAPIGAGEVPIEVRVLRTGKSVTHAEARCVVAGETAMITVGVFGRGRPSRISVIPRQPEPAVTSSDPVEIRYVEGFTNKFIRHFAIRWLRGGLPFTGTQSTEAVMEVGIEDSEPTSEEHVIAIADVPPPISFSMLRERATGSSVTWTIEFLRDTFADLPHGRWRLDAQVAAARDGYTSQSVMIWGPAGEPVALSHQSMVVFG
jgi:acyl-CoA thioesterase